MYELMSDFKDVFIMDLPNSQSDKGLELYKEELLRMKDYVEKKFEVSITDEDMRKAVKLENEIRVAKKNLVDTMKNDPCPVSGLDMFHVLYGSGFKFDHTAIVPEIEAVLFRLRSRRNTLKAPTSERDLVSSLQDARSAA